MKRILIVDDQSVIRWMIRLALRDNFTVDEADNAQAAWGRIKKQRPDGIVLDVLVTACGDNGDQDRGRAVGANGYFIKPISPLALANHFVVALSDARKPLPG